MEREPQDPDEQPLPAEGAPDNHEAGRSPAVTVAFGTLEFVPPEGSFWGEWVITRGIAEAEQEGRPIDDRSAYYIAVYLSLTSRGLTATSALRTLAGTGAIDTAGVQEELVSLTSGQTRQVGTWIEWLGSYCRTRADRGPVDNWRSGIQDQDRRDAEWLRREQVFASLDDLFRSVPPIQRVGNAGQPGWHGLVRHQGRSGGSIVSEGEPGVRLVWETDSDAELEGAYAEIVETQRRWIVETFGSATEPDDLTQAKEETED